jgi:sec-independent protein translocase protein TatC
MKALPTRLGHRDEASLVDHLDELRGRLFVIIAALAVGAVAAYAVHGHILDWLARPLPADHRQLVTFGVTEPFTVTLTVSIYAGFLLALPVILWQLWGFFAPAVEPRAERRAFGLAVFAAALGAAGLAFGYWVLLPRALHFLTNYDQAQFHILIQASAYFRFVSTVLLGVVCIFELPMVILGLVSIGALTATRLRKNRRLGYFIVATIALALPGPDPVTTALELLPMWILFEGSIWLAVLTERRANRLRTRLRIAEEGVGQ